MNNLLQMCTQFHIKEAVLVETDMYSSDAAGPLQYFLLWVRNWRNCPYNLLCLEILPVCGSLHRCKPLTRNDSTKPCAAEGQCPLKSHRPPLGWSLRPKTYCNTTKFQTTCLTGLSQRIEANWKLRL